MQQALPICSTHAAGLSDIPHSGLYAKQQTFAAPSCGPARVVAKMSNRYSSAADAYAPLSRPSQNRLSTQGSANGDAALGRARPKSSATNNAWAPDDDGDDDDEEGEQPEPSWCKHGWLILSMQNGMCTTISTTLVPCLGHQRPQGCVAQSTTDKSRKTSLAAL